MSFFGFDPEGLYAAGSSLAALDPQATSAATNALRGYDAAAAAVVHPVLSEAFTGFGDKYAALHHSLGPEVKRAGSHVAKGTNALSSGQNEAATTHTASLGDAQATQSELDRRIAG